MDCAKVQEMLAACLDDELGSSDKAGCSAHLKTCDSCRKEKELLERAWQFLEAAPPIEPSAAFRAKFWERVRQDEESTSWLSFPRLVPALAGFMAVWVVGVGLGSAAFFRASITQDSPTVSLMPAANASSLGTAYIGRMDQK